MLMHSAPSVRSFMIWDHILNLFGTKSPHTFYPMVKGTYWSQRHPLSRHQNEGSDRCATGES